MFHWCLLHVRQLVGIKLTVNFPASVSGTSTSPTLQAVRDSMAAVHAALVGAAASAAAVITALTADAEVVVASAKASIDEAAIDAAKAEEGTVAVVVATASVAGSAASAAEIQQKEARSIEAEDEPTSAGE